MATQDNSDPIESIALSDHKLDEAPVMAVVTAVAEQTGQSPLEMDPLAEVIDPAALQLLFGNSDDRPSSVALTFDYCGQQVTITADGIEVTDLDSTGR